MDAIKEIIVAYFQRIRTPVLGSIILVFVAVNWKAIYFVLFAEVSPELKFIHWDEHTDQNSLYFIPAWIGAGIAIGGPFLSLFSSYLVAWPVNEARLLTQESAHKISLQKANHQQQIGEYKEALLASKVRQQFELEKIDDEKAKKEVLEELDNIGESEVSIDSINLSYSHRFNSLDEYRWKLMEIQDEAANELDNVKFLSNLVNFRAYERDSNPWGLNDVIDSTIDKALNASDYLTQNSTSSVASGIFAEQENLYDNLRTLYMAIDPKLLTEHNV